MHEETHLSLIGLATDFRSI